LALVGIGDHVPYKDGWVAVGLDTKSDVEPSSEHGIVAAGFAVQTSADARSQAAPIAVTSDDAVTWHFVNMENNADFEASPTGVTFQSGTFVVEGSVQPHNSSGSDDTRPAAWYSDDGGATWTREADQSSFGSGAKYQH
jgi:hypothetical protein